MFRTHILNALRKSDVNKEVVLSGWASSIRDHGGIIFIDLRDRSGSTQIVINPSSKSYKEAKLVKSEYVIKIKGIVKERSLENINKNNPTGEIEIICSDLEILNKSKHPAFEINEESPVSDSMKMKYRYLYLRRASGFKRLEVRSKFFKAMRDFLVNEGFLEVDTPILNKLTPEGARPFVVPSRLNEGEFYALAQSPQLFKQILMVAGIEKYFQIAKCFRDEDLRADRQPEFLQLDIETSFFTRDDIINLGERLVKYFMKEVFNKDIAKIPMITYDEAMNKYGIDKPDLRFGLEIVDITDIAKDSDFKVFKEASRNGLVRAINAKNSAHVLSRKDIDDLTEHLKKFGAKGLAWIKINEDSSYTSVITKFLKDEDLKKIVARLDGKPNDILFFVADNHEIVYNSLGQLRISLGQKLNLIDKDELNFLWVVDFPLLEWNSEEKRYNAKHHPFTLYKKEDEDKLENDPLNVKSEAYDLVLNGSEVAGGSVRLFNEDQQSKVFKAMGFTSDEIEEKFGYLLEALRNGAPPHGGIAFGIDRFLAVMLKEESIREVIPFPKTQKGQCLMTEAPSKMSANELIQLNIQVIKKEK